MRTPTLGLTVTVLALSLAACGKKEGAAVDASAAKPVAGVTAKELADMPVRKPGLWEQTIEVEGAPPMTTRVCFDAETAAKTSVAGLQMANAVCPEKRMIRELDGSYTLSSTCVMGGATSKSSGKMHGDFNSAFTVETTQTTTGASTAAMNGTSVTKMSAKWDGPCPADWQPGDMEVPGLGRRVNINKIPAILPGAPK